MYTKEQAAEIAHISAIMGVEIFTELYEKKEIGLIHSTQLIAGWAVEFFEKNKHVETPETESEKQNECSWDDVIISFGRIKISELD